MSDWIEIGRLSDIPRRGARCIKTPVGRIAVFRTATDDVYAIEDRCPHKGGPLSQGIVHGAEVTCPLHNWVLSLETGSASGADEGAVRTFALKRDGERIFIDATTIPVVVAGPASVSPPTSRHANIPVTANPGDQ